METRSFLLTNPKLESLIVPYRKDFPTESDFEGYKNHCLRMLNVVLTLSEDEPNRMEKLEIALAFHDITVFPNRTLNYLESSSALARKYLSEIGRDEWAEEIALMICNHHKFTSYSGAYSNLVEPFRKADWVDVSFGILRYGLSKRWVKELHEQLPLYSFYPKTLFPVIGSYILRHPFNPLPNFKL